MTDEFEYDAFLSHSSRDKDVVREVANRLKSDGVRVWFDEWEIKPGDSIPAKIEAGLEHSRVLVLCMSAQAFGSDWAQLESHTFRFKDPLNHDRRFVPLRLDDAPLKGSLAQFLYINWRPNDREQEYPKLLEACRGSTKEHSTETAALCDKVAEKSAQLDIKSSAAAYAFSPDGKNALTGDNDNVVRLWDIDSGQCLRELQGHKGSVGMLANLGSSGHVWSVAWSADERLALSGSTDGTVRVWNLATETCIHVLQGHTSAVHGVALSTDQKRCLSVSWDKTLRLWDLETEKCIRVFKGHLNNAKAVAWSIDARHAVSGDPNGTVLLWDVEKGNCLRLLKGHSDQVRSLDWSADQRHVLSGAMDNTVRLWDVQTGSCLRVLEGHTSDVSCVAWSSDQILALSGSADNTVRLWNIQTGQCLTVLKGHSAQVWGVAWSADGRRAFSGDSGGGIRVWDLSEFVCEAGVPKGHATMATSAPDQVQYTNAKVLLVGDTQAGKTGLSNRLARGIYEKTDSTVGAWATQWKLPLETKDGVEREIWLWDFGGQADQRLIHQLYMDQTQLAALVFDPQKEDLFDTLGTWDRDLARAATQDFQKLLVAGRTDAGGLRSVSRAQVETFAKERGFARYLETSAKEDVGCAELKTAIVELINWEEMTKRTSPALFKRLKEEIVRLKEEGRVLMRFNELRDALTLRMSGGSRHADHFTDDELKTVISLLAGPGVVWELGFGSWILLQPELINSHAQAVIRSLREDEREIGCIAEERVLSGDLAFPKENLRLEPGEERIILLAMHQILVEHELCLRDEDPEHKSPTMLVFPSYARRERPELVKYPSVIVSYQFNGFLDDIYATLVVRLHHTQPFDRDQLWRDAADFKTMTEKRLGVKLTRRADGAGELEVYFDPEIPVEDMMVFSKYVHEHLLKKAKDVVRLRHYVCPHKHKGKPCNTEANREVAMERLAEKGRKATIICVKCEKRVKLWDDLETRFAHPDVQRRVQELEEQSKVTLDTESKERILVGDVISTVALAGQICREFSVSDHGIDMEIEFKDDDGNATGKKVYVQLKSGDAYLTTRKRDKAEIFRIPKQRHATYWMEQAFPVLLVVRSSEGHVRWMEIRDHLKEITENGNKQVRQIVFAGKRFDVMSVRGWRQKALE